MISPRPIAAVLIPALLLSACSFAPPYDHPPSVSIPASFKELPGWHAAAPSDAVARGEWWTIFNDPILDGLERKVLVSNQNLAAAKAAYDQARGLVREQRAALFPTLNLQANANDAGHFAAKSGGSTGTDTSSSSSDKAFQLGIGASWEPDLWGQIGNTVGQAKAQAQASEADLVNATLSMQGELALNYVQLRGIEAQQANLDGTVAAYGRALTITTNLYDSGVAARSDVLQAQTALANARGDAADLVRQRALLEHAIAVLVGENPSGFTLASAAWNRTVPDVPSVLPSELLQRRPDVASAERKVAAANAGIGVARAAFFPSFTLTGQAGQSAGGLGALFSAGSSAWSFGLSGLLSLLDFGARKGKLDQAHASFDQAVANYRQTALTAFQQTEDQLAASRVLATVAERRAEAMLSANRAEEIAQNQYKAGLVAYSSVIVAQTTALTARTADIQAIVNRQTAAIALIQAIGGRWEDRPAIAAAG